MSVGDRVRIGGTTTGCGSVMYVNAKGVVTLLRVGNCVPIRIGDSRGRTYLAKVKA